MSTHFSFPYAKIGYLFVRKLKALEAPPPPPPDCDNIINPLDISKSPVHNWWTDEHLTYIERLTTSAYLEKKISTGLALGLRTSELKIQLANAFWNQKLFRIAASLLRPVSNQTSQSFLLGFKLVQLSIYASNLALALENGDIRAWNVIC